MRYTFIQACVAAIATTSFLSPALAFPESLGVTTINLGHLDEVGLVEKTIWYHDVYNLGQFTDYYTFSVTAPSYFNGTLNVNATGLIRSTAPGDPPYIQIFKDDLQIKSLMLRKMDGEGFGALAEIHSSTGYSFSSLLPPGSYELTVEGLVLPMPSQYPPSAANDGWSSYKLSVLAAPVPEAPELALTSIGLAGVAIWVRRRKRG